MTATAFLGTSAFAAAVLERLAESSHRPTLVISRPDARAGRGRHLTPPPVIVRARELGLATEQPESVNTADTVARIRASGAELAVVCAFGAIITEPLLGDLEILNVHPSLLPRWRGAAPIERAIMAGDTETGVAIMELVAGLDSGPVSLCEATAIGPQEDYASLSHRLERLGGELLVRALDTRPPFFPQAQAGVTYAEKITATDRRLDPAEASASELARRVRALSPHIGAFLELEDGERLGVWVAHVVADAAGWGHGDIDLSGARPRVRCTEGVIELDRVQPPGRTAMAAEDWVRGRRR